MALEIRPLEDGDRSELRTRLARHWASSFIVTRGRLRDAATLPGFRAAIDGKLAGLLTYAVDGDELEIVTVNSYVPRRGVGSALVNAACEVALDRSLDRVWVVTTNDNEPAMRFYESLGFVLQNVYEGSIEVARRLKPSIPATGWNNTPIRDEYEYDWRPLVLPDA